MSELSSAGLSDNVDVSVGHEGQRVALSVRDNHETLKLCECSLVKIRVLHVPVLQGPFDSLLATSLNEEHHCA